MSYKDQLEKIRKIIFEDWEHIESVTEEEKKQLDPLFMAHGPPNAFWIVKNMGYLLGKIRECFQSSTPKVNK